MSSLSDWFNEARCSYCAYGADLIRTSCLLLRTTPSVMYRAAILFQRFQSVAEGVRTRRGDYNFSESDELSTSQAPTYTVPAHVGTESPSGIITIGDLFAPLDYIVFHLKQHDDITYLAAACVLIATKIEDPSARIRLIVSVFMRLNQRRRGEPVIELLQPPPERYEDFKLCVLDAEEVVLHALGFQTFVECPIKYAILFLGVLIDEDNDDEVGDNNSNGCVSNNHGEEQGSSLRLSHPSFASPLLNKWLADSVCWLNDIPRFRELCAVDAHELALCAIWATCPVAVTGLPEDWTLAFGVEMPRLTALLQLYHTRVEQTLISENDNLQIILSKRAKPSYPSEKLIADKAAAAAAAAAFVVGAPATGIVLPAEIKPPVPVVVPPPLPPPPPPPAPPQQPQPQQTESIAPSPLPCTPLDALKSVLNFPPPLPEAPRAERAVEDEFHFEDLRDLQRKRRQQEERDEEERRGKRRRSSSHRRRRHSSGRRRRRSSSRRRRDGSRSRQRRRHSPSGGASGRQQHQQRGGERRGERHRNEDRQRRDERQRNDAKPPPPQQQQQQQQRRRRR